MDSLPAGVRFYPTEPELVGFYLWNKLEHRRPDMDRVIPVVDVYNHEPMELPRMSGEASVRDPEQWFFFCRMQEREARGGRPTRTTPSGYWKATGSPTPVFHGNRIIGVRKTMVFYQGRAPTGCKTSWKMNEYRAAAHDEGEPATTSASSPKPASSSYNYADIRLRSEFSLCRVYKRSGHLRSFDRRPVVMVMNDNHRSSAVGDDGVGVSIAPPLGGTFPRPPEILGDAACVGGDYQMDGTVPGWELAALREEHAAVDSAGVDDDGIFDEEHWDRFLAGSDRSDAVTDGGGEDAIDPIHLVLN